jgi:hypothetical protein
MDKKNPIILTIESRIHAAKEFLVIVIGLGLTGAIAEKLKHDVGTDHAIGGEMSGFDLLATAVFVIYASRFFFNNWIYLSDSYSENKLAALSSTDEMRAVLGRARIDLLLNIFTGIIVCVAAMMLYRDRVEWLTLCIVAHYLIDLGALWYTVLNRKDMKNGQEPKMVTAWIINNGSFTAIFLILMGILLTNGQEKPLLVTWVDYLVLGFWLINSLVAFCITVHYRERFPEISTSVART